MTARPRKYLKLLLGYIFVFFSLRGWLCDFCFSAKKNIIEKIIEIFNDIFDEMKCGCDPISIYISISSEFCVELTLLQINTQYPQYIIIMELND
jgi:hypothetical protein